MRHSLFLSLLFILILPFFSSSQTISPVDGQNYYIIHSSGNVIGEGTDARTVIQTYTGGGSQILQFIPDGSGYYSVKIAGQEKYMSLRGDWNTYFESSNSTDNSKYAIEQVSPSYITLKCKANSRYLGTDNISAGSSVYSDKSGTDSKHRWFISMNYLVPPEERTEYSINPSLTYDKAFEGWGVSLCWWANMCGKWNDAKIDEIVNWLVSPQGLNYNIFRYNIGGGDDPLHRNCDAGHMASGKGIRAEMEGFKDGTNSGYDWSRDAAQRKIMLKIKEKRPDAIFEAFSNSAPYYMTYSGCVSGNFTAADDNLNPAYYQEFAHYLVDVCKHYKDTYGIEFRTLDPFNEPVTNYWSANGGQEGCHFSTSAQIDFLRILEPILRQSGLNTVISSADETSVAQSVLDFNAYVSAGILNLVGQFNTHTYTVNNQARVQHRALNTAYNFPLWMSEVGSGGTGIGGNLNLAKRLTDDIRYLRPEAWVDWQYIEENNDQWCLVQGNFTGQTYRRVKNYYVRMQYSKYIREGSHFLFVPNEQMLAALSPNEDSLIIVINNNSTSQTFHSIDLSQFGSIGSEISATRTSELEDNDAVNSFAFADSKLSVQLPAYSVTTIVVPIGKGTLTQELKTDVPYLIIARTANLMMKTNNDGLQINNYIHADSSQIWKLTPSGNGYTISNYEGKYVTDNGSYFAIVTSNEQAGQVFTFESIGDHCYKIMSESTGKAFDLQGESNTAGTAIGFYNYGNSPTAVHRQWILYELPSENVVYDCAGVLNGEAQFDSCGICAGGTTGIEPCIPEIEQRVALSVGWNLISFYVLADDMSISAVLPHASIVKNTTSFYHATVPSLFSTLHVLNPGDGYLVYNSENEIISISGTPIQEPSVISDLSIGWNLIGCPYSEVTTFEDSFGEELQNVQQIKNFNDYWIPNDLQSTIEMLEPGNGYFILK